MKLLKISVILFVLLGLSSCDNANKQPLTGSIDRSGKTITTTVYFYDTEKEVQDKFREIHKLSRDQKVSVTGFARWPEYKDADGNAASDRDKELTCTIHTVRPTKIDDEATLTLGHEMLHCIIGTYHPETRH